MADGTSDVAATLTGPAAAWLAERADELGVSDEVLLGRLVAAYRTAEETDADVDVATATDVEELRDRLDEVASEAERVEDVEAEFDEKIRDVRERVIQVKREADEKAPSDHDHDDLAARASAAAATAERVEREYESLAADVAARVDAGFENYEEVLSYLRDEADDLDRKVTTLATAVLSVRESVAALAGEAARQERVQRLQTTANREGVREADCEDCGESVAVALLSEPNCPFCDASFEDVESKSGWFGSHTLVTGEPPALEAGDSWMDDDAGRSWLDDDAALEEMAEESSDGGESSTWGESTSDEEGGSWAADVADDATDESAATDTLEETKHD